MCTTPPSAKPDNNMQTPTEMSPPCHNTPKKLVRKAKSREKLRGKKPSRTTVREIFQRLQSGEEIPQLGQEYDIPSTTIHRELRRFRPREYRRIMAERHPQHHIPISKTWKRLEGGESTRKIAASYHMSHESLSRQLEKHDKKRYQKIMSTRGRQRVVSLSEASNRLERGETLDKVAQRLGIPAQTLRRRLVKADKDRYMEIRRKRILGTIPPEILFAKLASGESVSKLAEEYDIYVSKLHRILQRIDKEKYEEIMEQTRTVKSEGYGSREAKIAGADSNFELQVRRILDDNGIQFYSPTLKVGTRRYFPDFMTHDGIIIEAAGVTNREYWERYREKARNYARHGHPALIVVPYNLRKRARDYLPHSRAVISVWISDFKRDPTRYIKTLISLRKLPTKDS